MKDLDKLDKKILYQLDCNCRQSSAQIGRKVHASKQVVDYRIKRLEKSGLIGFYNTIINSFTLGLSKRKLYLVLHNYTQAQRVELLNYICTFKESEWVGESSGKFDIVATFLVKSVYQFESILGKIEEKFSGIIFEKEIGEATAAPHWRKEYFNEGAKKKQALLQEVGSSVVTLDKKDEKIVQLLVNNANMPVTDMARRLSLSVSQVTYRLKQLEKKNVVLAYRFFVDLNSIDWIYCKSMIKLKNMNKANYQRLISYCEKIPHATFLIRHIGSWDVEIEFEIDSFLRFEKVMNKLREDLLDIIMRSEYLIVTKEYKQDYYPGSIKAIRGKD